MMRNDESKKIKRQNLKEKSANMYKREQQKNKKTRHLQSNLFVNAVDKDRIHF